MLIGIDASRAYIRDKTGTENYSYHLISAILRLPEAKSHIFVLFIRPKARLPKELVGYDNVIVKEVKLKYLWTQVGLAAYTWRRAAVTQLHGDTVARYLDVLWVPAHTLPILRNPKIKTVVTIHGLEYQWLPEYKNLLQRWYLPLSTYYAARSADQLIAVSKFTARELKKEVQNISKKINVVYEGVASSRAESRDLDSSTSVGMTMNKYGLQSKRYILFVGSVQPRKNLVALIEAFSHFASGYARDTEAYKLVIAGGIGWLAEEVLGAPARYRVQERVVFTGRVSDAELTALYLGASLYVQPSITEGFGLPVLEAMVSGVPVISSDGGALSEVVGKAGIVVELNDSFVKNLAEAMKRVVGSKNLQKQLISMGLKQAESFSWERAAEETLEVITG